MNIKNKVLIIEDDQVMRSALVETFQNNNYVVMQAEDGVAGYQLIGEFKPDLILLDLNLPLMSGLSILSKLRSEDGEWGEQVKVIVLTNMGTNSDVLDKVAAYSPSFYLIKSEVELSDVLDKAKECLV